MKLPHAIWTLPPGDAAYPKRPGWMKKEFTRQWLKLGGREQPRSLGQAGDGRRAVWQIRYWEHTIETVEDFERHFDCIHYHPVKQGYVRCPHQWQWSSFHRWVRAGVYSRHWACWEDASRRLDFSDIEDTTGEP